MAKVETQLEDLKTRVARLDLFAKDYMSRVPVGTNRAAKKRIQDLKKALSYYGVAGAEKEKGKTTAEASFVQGDASERPKLSLRPPGGASDAEEATAVLRRIDEETKDFAGDSA